MSTTLLRFITTLTLGTLLIASPALGQTESAEVMSFEITSTVPYDDHELSMRATGEWLVIEHEQVYVNTGVGGINDWLEQGFGRVRSFLESIGIGISRVRDDLRSYIANLGGFMMSFFNNATSILRFPAERLGSAVLNALRAVFTDAIHQMSSYISPLLTTLYNPMLPRLNSGLFTAGIVGAVASALRSVVIIIFVIALLSVFVQMLYGLVQQSSLSISNAAQEILRLIIIFMIAYSGQTIADAGSGVLNQMAASICGKEACDIGATISSMVFPTGGSGGVQGAGTNTPVLVHLIITPIILPIILFLGLAHLFAKIILSGYVILFAPLFIAFLAIPYGDAVFGFWLDGVKKAIGLLIVGVVISLLGSGIANAIGANPSNGDPIAAVASLGTGFVTSIFVTAVAVNTVTSLGSLVLLKGGILALTQVVNTALGGARMLLGHGRSGGSQPAHHPSGTGKSTPASAPAFQTTANQPGQNAPFGHQNPHGPVVSPTTANANQPPVQTQPAIVAATNIRQNSPNTQNASAGTTPPLSHGQAHGQGHAGIQQTAGGPGIQHGPVASKSHFNQNGKDKADNQKGSVV